MGAKNEIKNEKVRKTKYLLDLVKFRFSNFSPSFRFS
jgi:hypothetical protein